MIMADQNWAFVAAAYTAAWLVIAGYWLYVHRAVRRARRQFDEASGAGRKRPEGR